MKKAFIALLVGVLVVGVTVGAASAKSGKSAATVDVCVLLPDTKSSVRWEQFDRPSFLKALKAAGVKASVTNALADPQKQLAQAETCINNGAKVGVITSLDTGTSIAIQKKFTAVGGFDERFAVSHNEVDLCLRLERAGFANVVTPYSRVEHVEGASRAFEVEPAERARLAEEEQLFRERWKERIAATDPAHHPAPGADGRRRA